MNQCSTHLKDILRIMIDKTATQKPDNMPGVGVDHVAEIYGKEHIISDYTFNDDRENSD